MITASALVLMVVVVVLGHGDTTVPSSSGNKSTTSFARAFLPIAIQPLHALQRHKPVTQSTSNAVHGRLQSSLKMQAAGKEHDRHLETLEWVKQQKKEHRQDWDDPKHIDKLTKMNDRDYSLTKEIADEGNQDVEDGDEEGTEWQRVQVQRVQRREEMEEKEELKRRPERTWSVVPEEERIIRDMALKDKPVRSTPLQDKPVRKETYSKDTERKMINPYKGDRADDPQLQDIIDEIWAVPGSSRRQAGEGPLLPAIRRERFPSVHDKQWKVAPYKKQGLDLIGLLETWKDENTRIRKMGGEIKASAADKEIAETAIGKIQVALGTLAAQVIPQVDSDLIDDLANPKYLDESDSTNSGHESDTPEPDSQFLLPRHVPYAINKVWDYHDVCIVHGSERLFEHDKIRARIRAIKIMVHDAATFNAADVFVDAVAMDLEAERAKHKGLSRHMLIEWANAVYKARLVEAHNLDKHTELAHKFERRLWVAVARVLMGKRQQVLNDDDI